MLEPYAGESSCELHPRHGKVIPSRHPRSPVKRGEAVTS